MSSRTEYVLAGVIVTLYVLVLASVFVRAALLL